VAVAVEVVDYRKYKLEMRVLLLDLLELSTLEMILL
jgi:hypothetical protein